MSSEETKTDPAAEAAEENCGSAAGEAAGADSCDAETSAGETSETESEGGSGGQGDSSEPDWKDMYARMLADFDNYRKRTARDREELVKFATSEAVKDMLPTADNLSIALDQAKDKEDPFVKGVKLAYEGFLKALKEHGAEPFESLGETLDPNRHEAIATLPSDTVEEGRISAEAKKGWMLNGRLLRAAQVVVSSGKAEK